MPRRIKKIPTWSPTKKVLKKFNNKLWRLILFITIKINSYIFDFCIFSLDYISYKNIFVLRLSGYYVFTSHKSKGQYLAILYNK